MQKVFKNVADVASSLCEQANRLSRMENANNTIIRIFQSNKLADDFDSIPDKKVFDFARAMTWSAHEENVSGNLQINYPYGTKQKAEYLIKTCGLDVEDKESFMAFSQKCYEKAMKQRGIDLEKIYEGEVPENIRATLG